MLKMESLEQFINVSFNKLNSNYINKLQNEKSYGMRKVLSDKK